MPKVVSLVLAEGISGDAVHRALIDGLGCVAGEPDIVEHAFYDTFDGRLFRAGLVLEHERTGRAPNGVAAPVSATDVEPPAEAWLRLRRLGELEATCQAPLDEVPTDPARLTDARLRDQVVEATEGRALLPVVATRTLRRAYRALGPEAKTTVRLLVNAPTALPPDRTVIAAVQAAARSRARALGETVTLSAVRGYDADFARVLDRLSALVGERPAPDPLVGAARALGIAIGVDPSDPRIPLVAEAPASAAVAALLERLVAVMEVNEPGLRTGLDIEFLHDFRVAVRRARTIVRAAKGVLDDEVRDQLTTELKWLGDMTTPVRDLDVYLEGGPPEAELTPLWALLEADRAAAQAALIAALDSERYRQFRALVTRVTRPREVPQPGPSTGRWAAKAVRKAHRALIREGREAANATELHEVRKAGKRLRYLLDAFSPVFAADATATVIKDLKALQNVLGAMQDGAVHAEMLAAAGARLDGAPTATLLAIGRLIEVEHQRQRKAAGSFAERFERFAADGDRVDDALSPLERA